jgi:bacteriocin biosynthesis docking scaffold, sagD family
MADTRRGWTSLKVADTVYSRFVSPLTGIVNSIYNQLHETDDIPGYAVGARACEGTDLVGAPVNSLNGGGALSYIEARVAAIGETIERYSAAYVPDNLIVGDYASDLNDDAFRYDWNLFHPRQYIEDQFPFVPITPGLQMSWAKGRNLVTGSQVAVPADLVYLSPLPRRNATVGYSTSNGLACGLTETEALVSAIFEAFERHAFVLTWHASLTPPRVDGDRLLGGTQFWQQHVKPTGLDVRLFALSELVGVPTVLAVVLNTKTESAPIAFGAASAASIATACRKAIVEAFQTRVWIKAEQRSGNTLRFDGNWASNINSFDDHVRLFAGPDSEQLWEAIHFLTEADRFETCPTNFDFKPKLTPAETLDSLLKVACSRNIELFAVDVTSPDVKEEGVVVMKVVSPQLAQLDATYLGRFLGNPSFYGPLPWGNQNSRGFDDLNLVPHPFP